MTTEPTEQQPAVKRSRFGIREKILVYGGLPTVLIMAVVIVVTIESMYQGLVAVSNEMIKTEVRSAASIIDKANLESSVVPQVMSIAQETGMFGRRAESLRFARQILEDFPNFVGVYFAYEDDADEADTFYVGTDRLETGALSETGRFIPYWHRSLDDLDTLVLEPLANTHASYYYQGVRNRVLGLPEAEGIEIIQTDRDGNELERLPVKSVHYDDRDLEMDVEESVMITEPYLYMGRPLLEQTFPIIIEGEFKGIAGVDRSLEDLQAFLGELEPFATADFFLLSRRGRVIAATMQGEPLPGEKGAINIETFTVEEAVPFNEILVEIYLHQMRAQGGQVFFDRVIDMQHGTEHYYVGVHIPTGEWTLIMRVERAEIMETVGQTIFRAILVAGIGLLLVMLFLIWLAGNISRRIRAASEAATRVADGDLTVQIEEQGSDESGLLLGSIRRMVGQLNNLLTKVKQASIQVMSTTTKLNATSTQQERVVGDFGASTTQIAAAVKEISATSQQLVRTMDDVRAMVEGTVGLATEGRTRIDTMEHGMNGLAEATVSIADKLSVISEKANNIGAVVTAITKVADQTNLLSLNAAIEAEKAGEYGLGFAVVAREIRRLADQTAVATLDIEQMVKEMQGSVSSGVMEIDRFTEEVRTGVQETVETSEQFGKILEQVQGLTPRFEMVFEGMQSQSQGAEQISDAMAQLTEAAKQSGAAVQEMKAASQSLQDAVNELKQEVSRFKVS